MASNYNALKSSETNLQKIFYDFFAHVIKMQDICDKYLSDRNLPVAQKVKIFDTLYTMEEKSNNFEAEIMEECCWIISKDMPKANHLRFVIAVLNSIKELERMSDYIINIINLYKKYEGDITLEIKKIIAQAWKNSSNITKEFYETLQDENNNFTYEQYVEVFDQWQTKYGEYLKELGNVLRVNQNSTKYFEQINSLLILKNIERNVDQSINIVENFLYIGQSSFFFEKKHKQYR